MNNGTLLKKIICYGINVDFSLAINNFTGKYYLGRDIISALGERVETVVYGRSHFVPQNDIFRRVLGRLFSLEHNSRILPFPINKIVPLQKNKNPTLHLDPLTVLNYRLSEDDVVLCHDVGPVTHPQYFHEKTEKLYRLAYSKIKKSNCNMVFVSEYSMNQFKAMYGDDYSSFQVIYIPVRKQLNKTSSYANSPKIDSKYGKYFLTVGSIGTRKNQINSIKAFALSGLYAQGYSYLLVGSKEAGYEEAVIEAEATPGVKVIGYVSDEELDDLYKNAVAFVLMSRLEGFGMPIIEAAEYGLPCLVSSDGIFDEIGGPSMFSADENEPADISTQLIRIANLTIDERTQAVNDVIKYVERYNPDEIFSDWVKLIDSVLVSVNTKV